MHSVTVVLLHAFVMQGFAKDQKSTDQASDDLVNKLVDRLLGGAEKNANLDNAIFAKTHPDMGLPSARLQSRSVVLNPAAWNSAKYSIASKDRVIASLPGPSAMKNLVVSEIEKLNRGCRVYADKAELAKTSIYGKYELNYPMMDYTDKIEEAPLDKVKEMPGVTAPIGFFDPFGLSTRVPEGQLLFFRDAELKHGRVCMLAVLGLAAGERHDFFPIMSAGIPDKMPAFELSGPFIQETGAAQFWPIVLGALFVEEWRGEAYKKNNPDKAPGDYGFDPLRLKDQLGKTPEDWKQLQNRELNNGRLAMFAAAGWIAQEQYLGKNLFFNN